jgi:AcrR family transcriptional regulator
MARRNDHSRDELHLMALEAAEHLLDESGPAGLSMRRIAQRIGYTHGTLYLIFSNLDALLAQVNARTLEALVTELERAASSAAPGRERLLALAQAYLEFARERTARWRLVFEHHPPESVAVPAEAEQHIQRGFGILAAALVDGATVDGAPMSGRRAGEELGAALWAAVHGVTVLALDRKLINATGEDLDAQRLLACTVDVFLDTGKDPAARG